MFPECYDYRNMTTLEKLIVRPVYDERNRKIGWSLYRDGVEVDSKLFLNELLAFNNIGKKDVEIQE